MIITEKDLTDGLIRDLTKDRAMLLEACKDAREAIAALLRAIYASGYSFEVMDEIEPGHDGIGIRLQEAIREAGA